MGLGSLPGLLQRACKPWWYKVPWFVRSCPKRRWSLCSNSGSNGVSVFCGTYSTSCSTSWHNLAVSEVRFRGLKLHQAIWYMIYSAECMVYGPLSALSVGWSPAGGQGGGQGRQRGGPRGSPPGTARQKLLGDFCGGSYFLGPRSSNSP